MAVFENGIKVVLGEATDIANQRGQEYADTWALANQNPIFLKQLLAEFGITLQPWQLREILICALIDTKDSRMLGGYKEDTIVDGVNYRAVYAFLRRKRMPDGSDTAGTV